MCPTKWSCCKGLSISNVHGLLKQRLLSSQGGAMSAHTSPVSRLTNYFGESNSETVFASQARNICKHGDSCISCYINHPSKQVWLVFLLRRKSLALVLKQISQSVRLSWIHQPQPREVWETAKKVCEVCEYWSRWFVSLVSDFSVIINWLSCFYSILE